MKESTEEAIERERSEEAYHKALCPKCQGKGYVVVGLGKLGKGGIIECSQCDGNGTT